MALSIDMKFRFAGVSFAFVLLTLAGTAFAFVAPTNVSVISVSAWNADGKASVVPSKLLSTGGEAFIDDFIEVALGRECAISHTGVQSPLNCSSTLIRWKGPIRYDVYGANSQEGSFIEETLAFLGVQPGLTVERVEKMREANLQIRFYRTDQLKKFMALILEVAKETGLILPYSIEVSRKFSETEQFPCIAFLHSSEDGKISHAAIYVHADLAKESAERCISSTLLQVTGLPNNKSGVSGSLLGARSDLTKFTDKDKRFIQLLYDERISAGMSRIEVKNALNKAK